MRDDRGHFVRAGQIRAAFHDLGTVRERCELLLVIVPATLIRPLVEVVGLDRQTFTWTSEAMAGTWLIGYEIGSSADEGPYAPPLHVHRPDGGPPVNVDALRLPAGAFWNSGMLRVMGDKVAEVRRIALVRAAGYKHEPIPDRAPPTYARERCVLVPVDPLADPGKRAAYYGTRDVAAEPKPTRRQCGTCEGTGGDAVGALCGSCGGAGTVRI